MKKNKKNKKNFTIDKKKIFTPHFFITASISLILGIAAFFFSYSQCLYSIDNMVSSYVYKYNPFEKADDRITIIAIDDEAIEEYGDVDDWSRSLYADAVTVLDENNAAIIALDTDLSEEKDSSGDQDLVSACQNASSSKIIALANASYESEDKVSSPSDSTEASSADSSTEMPSQTQATETSEEDSQKNFNIVNAAKTNQDFSEQVQSITFPYSALMDVVSIGVGNAVSADVNGTIRNAALTVKYKDEEYDSFATSIYKNFLDLLGQEYNFPSLDSLDQFGFNTIYNLDSYQIISFSDLLSGDYDESYIDGHITIIGEYDADDSSSNYYNFIRSDISKQEVLVESGIVQTLLNNKNIVDVNSLFQSILYGIIIFSFYAFLSRKKSFIVFMIHIITIAFGVFIAYTLNAHGYRLLLLTPVSFAVLSFNVHLIQNLMYANIEKRKMRNTLNMYVDSKVVDQITEMNPMNLRETNRRKNIAVLFVDIRGFTSMSERLTPEEVVDILNRYFTIVYSSITAWNGTLDKFIGDAAMAIFNAPNEVEDYAFKAVCAADDIMVNFEAVKAYFKEKYDGEIDIGIGIHCGEAIVGNIGCFRRMDYTAIGDTVNTASRLESKAGKGQIILSREIIENVNADSERISIKHVGDWQLKGKSNLIPANELTKIFDKPTAPNLNARKELIHEAALLHSQNRGTK